MNMESITAKGYRIFAATLLTQKQKGPVSAASKHPQNPVLKYQSSLSLFSFSLIHPIGSINPITVKYTTA